MARTISAAVTIDAAPAEVWAVLCDLVRWPEWCPDISRATGMIQAGSEVVFANVLPNGRTLITRRWVVAARPGAELRWRPSPAFGREHSFTLSPVDSGTRTEVVQSSTIPGYLVWLAWLAAATAWKKWAVVVQIRLDGVNQALKHRTEQDRGTT